MHRGLLVLALGIAIGGPARATAHAEKSGGEDAAIERAKQHFEDGRGFQRQRAYDRAVAEYLQAYKLAPRPELLFNVAQCFRLGGHAEPAIAYYQRFLDEVPSGIAADEARGHVVRLRAELEAERVRSAPPAPAPAPRPVPAPPADRLALTEAARGTAAARRAAQRSQKWIGVTAVVTGSALVGTGAYLGWRAHDEATALGAASGPWTPALEAREEAAQLDARRMWIFVGGGSALLLGGGALWWWASRPAAVVAAPELASDRAGVIVRGTF